MKSATAAESRYLAIVARVPCVICTRFGQTGQRVEIHHVAAGSSQRSHWLVVPLCTEHHRGKSGLHGIGTKAFCALYRPLGDIEHGLVAWLNQDMAKLREAA